MTTNSTRLDSTAPTASSERPGFQPPGAQARPHAEGGTRRYRALFDDAQVRRRVLQHRSLAHCKCSAAHCHSPRSASKSAARLTQKLMLVTRSAAVRPRSAWISLREA